MENPCRACWQNCGVEADAEILTIDAMEDAMVPLDEQTKQTIIHDAVDGHEAKISLAMAIDLLFPCHWDFVGAVAVILKAIGGDLHPEQPYTCCARNLRLSPLYSRVRTISNTLAAFWKEDNSSEDVDTNLLAVLGTITPEKRWLAASLDKTIRLQLEAPPDFWLTFS